MTTTVPMASTAPLPRAWNGYAVAPQPALSLVPEDVRPGDFLLLDDCVSVVHEVRGPWLLDDGTTGYKINGDRNIFRLRHERLRVIRGTSTEETP